jgi:ubiquinone/menaquinone biosynthesis C-methylase UbiE
LLVYIVLDSIKLIVAHDVRSFSAFDGLVVLAAACAAYFLSRHRYLLALLLLAVPVRLSLIFRRFEASEKFDEIHKRLIGELAARGRKLLILDISTGTCNSLLRHGWTELDAEFTALDLSETMLLQGRKITSELQIPVEFVLGDAAELPFVSQTFDVVLNYGAVNGMTDPKRALEEMARVAKPKGLVLFLDEQLYTAASLIERLYFRFVLSSHNVIHSCPVEAIPRELEQIEPRQVYEFYYLCTAYKP